MICANCGEALPEDLLCTSCLEQNVLLNGFTVILTEETVPITEDAP